MQHMLRVTVSVHSDKMQLFSQFYWANNYFNSQTGKCCYSYAVEFIYITCFKFDINWFALIVICLIKYTSTLQSYSTPNC